MTQKKSLPPRERGLKLMRTTEVFGCHEVAPTTGAWIETLIPIARNLRVTVAPTTGAWIETTSHIAIKSKKNGRSHHGSVD